MASVSQDDVTSASTETFTTALVLNAAVAGVQLVAFILLRNRFRKIYSPRTYLVPPKNRVENLPHGFLSWIPAIIKADPTQIIAKNGLDAYCFVRFLFLMLKIFVPVTVVTWVILLPVDAAASGGTKDGVERFTFGNVGTNAQPRYAAHLLLVYAMTFYVLYLIKQEYAAFVVLRQDFLISKEHSRLAQSKTVLVTGVPKDLLNVEAFHKLAEFLPGGIKKIWIARDLKELPDLYERRQKAHSKLESATTKLFKAANKAIVKDEKAKSRKGAEAGVDVEAAASSEIDRWVPKKGRPSHKLGKIPCTGEKVDTIEWSRNEIAETTAELEKGRAILRSHDADATYPPESAVFIQFNQQIAAHIFAQVLSHHLPLRMAARYLEVAQENVIWSNLNINPYQARVRYAISWALTLGLIILWSFPVAFVGLISNVNKLCVTVPWLGWLCTLPSPVNGIIQGALPPIALAVLFMLLPIVLRLFARLEGIPLKSGIELSLMTRFFLFLVIHGFLIVTLASGLVSAIPQITQDPTSAVTLLAQNLPTASIFFLTFICVKGLSGAAGSLLQIVSLIVYYVKMFLLASTPRSVFGIKYTMGSPSWGTLFPNMTLLTVIGIVYSIIAPLVAGFAMLAFGLFWFVYKYLFLWVYDVPTSQETGGLYYPKAMTHIFVGMYIQQVCLAGLFFLAQDQNGKQSAIPQGAFMVILIVCTIFFQLTLKSGYGPLIDYLPISLATRMSEIQHEARDENSHLAPGEKSTYPPAPHGSDEHLRGGKDAADTATLPGEEHLDEHAFDHPASYEDQKTVWIPVDDHGFYKHELESGQAAKVQISSEGAAMKKGKVDVSRSPPDEDWDETQTL